MATSRRISIGAVKDKEIVSSLSRLNMGNDLGDTDKGLSSGELTNNPIQLIINHSFFRWIEK